MKKKIIKIFLEQLHFNIWLMEPIIVAINIVIVIYYWPTVESLVDKLIKLDNGQLLFGAIGLIYIVFVRVLTYVVPEVLAHVILRVLKRYQ